MQLTVSNRATVNKGMKSTPTWKEMKQIVQAVPIKMMNYGSVRGYAIDCCIFLKIVAVISCVTLQGFKILGLFLYPKCELMYLKTS